jgi:large subunit ribosomal protein L30
METITIKLVRGLAGKRKDQIAVVKSLGLNKTGSVSVQPDNEATRGKINKVSHLVEIVK